MLLNFLAFLFGVVSGGRFLVEVLKSLNGLLVEVILVVVTGILVVIMVLIVTVVLGSVGRRVGLERVTEEVVSMRGVEEEPPETPPETPPPPPTRTLIWIWTRLMTIVRLLMMML